MVATHRIVVFSNVSVENCVPIFPDLLRPTSLNVLSVNHNLRNCHTGGLCKALSRPFTIVRHRGRIDFSIPGIFKPES